MHYYQFNIGDYAKATRHLSNTEDLVYRRLIDLYYDKEQPLIKDMAKLSRLINMRDNKEEIAAVLDDFFEETEEGYKQSRIEHEIANYHAKADAARVNGKKGGRPRKAKPNPEKTQGKAKKTQLVNLANPELTQCKPNPNPEKSESKANQEPRTINQLKDIDSAPDPETGFDEFYAEYPRKRDKAKALKAWVRHGCSKNREMINTDIRKRKERDRQWVEGFIPYPATYLNGSRWEDEIEEVINETNKHSGTTSRRQHAQTIGDALDKIIATEMGGGTVRAPGSDLSAEVGGSIQDSGNVESVDGGMGERVVRFAGRSDR